MSGAFAVTDVFLNATALLAPKTAVAAIVLDEHNRALLQLRDDKAEIFFPNHWSCFGGAVEEGETPEQTLVRELEEELGITFKAPAIETFIKIAFNPKVTSKTNVDRFFFIVRITPEEIKNIQLGEGQGFELFSYADVMKLANITPYDKFALWLYFNQNRLAD